MLMLELKDLTFRYPGGRPILNRVGLTVDEGERVGLSAPSGKGKTTLCRLAAGYETVQSGEILLDGKPLSAYRGHCPVQLIMQHPEQAVNPRLRMRNALTEGGPVTESTVRELGIEKDWLDRYPSELSGGELQRFCIARALGQKTRYLLADEITAMLDSVTQSQIWHFLLRQVQERGIGMLIVSHQTSLLDLVCTRKLEL